MANSIMDSEINAVQLTNEKGDFPRNDRMSAGHG